ncbi:major Facilitator Superfamily protein, partial [Vibrio parahaemolyticus V-223/04]
KAHFKHSLYCVALW